MLRPMNSRTSQRRGNILIVTLSLLALLAVVGVAAVYYTKDQAERARIQGMPGADIAFPDDGAGAAMSFLSGLIYDTQDHGPALLNSARGHSPSPPCMAASPGANIAWNGPGTFGGTTSATFGSIDRRQLLNHRLFSGMTNISDPEYTGERAPGTSYPAPYNGTYYGKNAPYTYPDFNNYFLATICPATGEVLVPSFHRTSATAFGSLDPSNPNWTSASGKFLTPRPRPQEHPNFPRVPQNADGTYTGDVQNLPGGFYMSASGQPAYAHNDSIWIDTGLPAFSLPNGKRIKPLVAPLIIDLDGRLNLNIHGNVMNSGAHASGSGFGPWEVNLSKAFGAEGTAIVNARGAAATRAGISSKAFAPRLATGNELPKYAQVAWTGFTGANPLQLPGSSAPTDLYFERPTYSNGYNWTNAVATNHPSLFNPSEWMGGTGPAAFTLNDTKLLTQRYAPYPYTINQLSIAGTAPTTFVGTQPGPAPNPPAQGTSNPYRTDASHANRMIATTLSASLSRSMLMPGTGVATDPNATVGMNLGPIDLNRPLADYRNDTTQPLSTTTVTAASIATADADRKQFATDIFARLIASTGATGATINLTSPLTVTVNGGATAAEITTLRQLAQLAVNIVDYIDNDDICTGFVWNSSTPTEVVYGVEKPRLVINEAYAEVVNDPTDDPFTNPMGMTSTASKEAQVRFWVELQNPTSTPHSAATTPPLGDGSVSFGAQKPYKLEIVTNTKLASGVANNLRVPTNTKGDAGAAADITFDFTTAAAGFKVPPADGQANSGIVVVAADSPAPTDAMVMPMWTGFQYTAPAAPVSPAVQTINAPAIGGANAMSYKVTLPPGGMGDNLHSTSDATYGKLSRNVVLLRRLANPYLPEDTTNTPSTNPYITVDVLDNVRVGDRLMVESGKKWSEKRTAAGMVNGAGYDPNPQSTGKVQPYAAFCLPTVNTQSALNYPTNAMLMPQNPTPAVTSGVRHTLGRQNSQSAAMPAAATTPANGGETLQAPFDWYVHMDRPLVNQLELLHVTTGAPHDATYNFVGANGAKYVGSTQTVLLAGTAPYQQLYRALELLSVQPYGHQTALGGRIHGRININTIQDKRVWDALFDAQGTNNTFDQTFVDTLWNTLMATRTLNTPPVTTPNRYDATGTGYSCPIPAATIHDTGTAGDRPFLPFGVATVAGGTATFGAGVGLDDTLLRRNPTAMPVPIPYIAVTTATHPYQQAEALRKILNNTTTVSHTFAVWITVGYFEVESETASPVGVPYVTLGKEYYREAPGDTRKKFFSIVDRSNIGYEPTEYTTPPAAGTPYTQVARPYFTTIEENAAAGAVSLKVSSAGGGNVYADGVPVTIGGSIVVGTGANQEVVTATVASDAAGVATLTVSALTKPHYAGEPVSNIMPGNPGPPTDFDPNMAKYKAVVPLWVKLQ
ncbi:MAG: hypothetical protein U0792_10385 [Gemmataceae bacterium]